MLRLSDQWIWDSWIADDGTDYHLFFLQAPSALEDGSLRHARARVGHASSTDLRDWTYTGEVFGPAPGGWDDVAIWTGSTVLGPDHVWRMFYTAISSRGHGLRDQRIGVAVSDDLVRWRRVGEQPIITADPAVYTTLAEDQTASETWRDPFVFADPDGDGWHMLITARAVGADRNDDGVLAHARTEDLQKWRLGPPLCAPGAGFGQLEVPQARAVDGRHVLVFTCHPEEQTPQRRARHGRASTWYVVSDSPIGPWDLTTVQPFLDDPWLFAAPLVQDRAGSWNFLGFRNLEHEGILCLEIVDPIPVGLIDGRLRAVGPVPTYDLDARRVSIPG